MAFSALRLTYAKENDEVDLYRTSYRLNSECKQAIHEAIADNYDGMYLGDGAVDQVVRQYGMERVGYILANTLRYQNLTSLNRRVLVELVESITVYDKEHIHIQYRFDQEIRNVLEYCSSVPAAETEESAV